MILSDKTISRMLGEGSLVIEPLTDGQIQPASVDVRLGNTFSVVDDTPSGIITLSSKINYKTITADSIICLFTTILYSASSISSAEQYTDTFIEYEDEVYEAADSSNFFHL